MTQRLMWLSPYIKKFFPHTYTGWLAFIVGHVLLSIGVFYAVNADKNYGAINVVRDWLDPVVYGCFFVFAAGMLLYVAVFEDDPAPRTVGLLSSSLIAHIIMVIRITPEQPIGILGVVYLVAIFALVMLSISYSLSHDQYPQNNDIIKDIEAELERKLSHAT